MAKKSDDCLCFSPDVCIVFTNGRSLCCNSYSIILLEIATRMDPYSVSVCVCVCVCVCASLWNRHNHYPVILTWSSCFRLAFFLCRKSCLPTPRIVPNFQTLAKRTAPAPPTIRNSLIAAGHSTLPVDRHLNRSRRYLIVLTLTMRVRLIWWWLWWVNEW